jgi:hypothetical protein
MAVTIDAGDVEDIRPRDKPDVGLPSGGGSARAGLRQAPGIPGPPVPSGRTTLADCACASPRFGSRSAAARIDGSTGSGFEPDRARCGVRRDSELQSLQSGRSASVAVRLPNDNLQCRQTIADSLLSVQDRYN